MLKCFVIDYFMLGIHSPLSNFFSKCGKGQIGSNRKNKQPRPLTENTLESVPIGILIISPFLPSFSEATWSPPPAANVDKVVLMMLRTSSSGLPHRGPGKPYIFPSCRGVMHNGWKEMQLCGGRERKPQGWSQGLYGLSEELVCTHCWSRLCAEVQPRVNRWQHLF